MMQSRPLRTGSLTIFPRFHPSIFYRFSSNGRSHKIKAMWSVFEDSVQGDLSSTIGLIKSFGKPQSKEYLDVPLRARMTEEPSQRGDPLRRKGFSTSKATKSKDLFKWLVKNIEEEPIYDVLHTPTLTPAISLEETTEEALATAVSNTTLFFTTQDRGKAEVRKKIKRIDPKIVNRSREYLKSLRDELVLKIEKEEMPTASEEIAEVFIPPSVDSTEDLPSALRVHLQADVSQGIKIIQESTSIEDVAKVRVKPEVKLRKRPTFEFRGENELPAEEPFIDREARLSVLKDVIALANIPEIKSPQISLVNAPRHGFTYTDEVDYEYLNSISPRERLSKNALDVYKKQQFSVLSTKADPQEVVSSDTASIPRLAYDLETVLSKPGVHPIQKFHNRALAFDESLLKIPKSSEIDYNTMPTFTPSSKDDALHKLAVKHKCKFKGSTSSVGDSLIQFYMLFSRANPIDTSMLSPEMQNMSRYHVKRLRNPSVILLRKRGDTYSIDADPGDRPKGNKILMDLGNALERMVTMDADDFRRKHLFSSSERVSQPPQELSYHYLKVKDLLLRSQIDCHSPAINGPHKSFDLKTRATLAIRADVENVESTTYYKLTELTGKMNSYEREFYDMSRSAFLKYSYQVRIGKMNGIFVTYHNTKQLLGFEYVPLKLMDKILFGSTEFAEKSFDIVLKLLQIVLQKITSTLPKEETLRIVFSNNQLKDIMNIYVEIIPRLNDKVVREDPSKTLPSPFRNLHTKIHRFDLELKTFFNGEIWEKRITSTLSEIEILYRITKAKITSANMREEYWKALRTSLKYEEIVNT